MLSDYRFKTYQAIQQRKKTLETIKEDLFNSLKEIDDEDKLRLEEMVASTKNVNEVIRMIKQYEEISKIKKYKDN